MSQIVANKIKQSITELVGHTPLLALNQYKKRTTARGRNHRKTGIF